MGLIEFWSLTPRETLTVMEAAVWSAEKRAAGDLSLAWHTAVLTRTKRIPTLRKLLQPFMPSKAKLQPIEERRREFQEMKAEILPQLAKAVENFRSSDTRE